MQTQATIKAFVASQTPQTNKKVTKRVRAVFEELLASNTKCPELWLYRKDEEAFNVFIGIRMACKGKVSFIHKVAFALADYKWNRCAVCGEELITPRREVKTCHGSCTRAYTNGGKIPKVELAEAVAKFGINAKLTKKEMKTLAAWNEARFDGLPARKQVRQFCTVLDLKVLTYTGKTYSERVARAVLGAEQNCFCGEPLKYKPSTGLFSKTCSQACSSVSAARLDKIKTTTLERHGAIGFQLQKTKDTLQSKYGGNPITNAKVKAKAKGTLLKNYGVDNPSQSKVIQKRKEALSLGRYGVRNPNQTKSAAAKSLDSAFKRKEYKLGRRLIKVQGYEPQALDYMRKAKVKASDICTVWEKTIPSIKYSNAKNRGCVYFPDFYIPRKNVLVEVKSIYTIAPNKAQWKLNKRKFKACSDQGYKLIVMVMEQNGSRVILPSDWMSMTFTQIKKALKEAVRRQP